MPSRTPDTRWNTMSDWKIKRKLYRDVKMKSGDVLKKGTVVFLAPTDNHMICTVSVGTNDYKMRWTSVVRPPSMNALMEQDCDGICETIRGERVEPDGIDDHGFPSWLLALGMI